MLVISVTVTVTVKGVVVDSSGNAIPVSVDRVYGVEWSEPVLSCCLGVLGWKTSMR